MEEAEEDVLRKNNRKNTMIIHGGEELRIAESDKCKENGGSEVRRNSSGYYSGEQNGQRSEHGKHREFVLANKTNNSVGVHAKSVPPLAVPPFAHVKPRIDSGLTTGHGPPPRHSRQSSLPAGHTGAPLRPGRAGGTGGAQAGKKSDPTPPPTYTRKYSASGFKVPDLPTAGSFNRNSTNRRSLTRLFSRSSDKGGIKTPFGEVSGRPASAVTSDKSDKEQEKPSRPLGKRSLTSLSLFSSRKDGEEEASPAPKDRKNSLTRLRAARSSLDLSSIGLGGLSRAGSKAQLQDLKEEPNQTKERKAGNDRPWFDLRGVWKQQTADLPTDDMFHMMRKERAGRARTVPSRLGSLETSSVQDLTAEGGEPAVALPCHTPSTLKKTVALLSPEVITNWYEKRKVENCAYGPRRNSISNLFWAGDKKQSSPLIELRNGDKLRKSMLNLDELLMGEGGANSLSGKGVQRSESAKVTNESKRWRTRGVQRSESARLLTMRQVSSSSMAPRQNSHPNLGQQTSYSLSSSSLSDRSLESPSKLTTCSLSNSDYVSPDPAPPDLDLSDLEAEADPPDWRHSLSEEALARLSSRELKRQDVINELFHTERSHVRNLKVLDMVFRRPLLDTGRMERGLVERLFPHLDEVLALHQRYNSAMKARLKAGFPVADICDILSDMFLAESGAQLMLVAGNFTKSQTSTIEELKRVRGRDVKLDQFLSELERRPACRRLQLQSILPCEHQRLVKYPLLLEQVAKYTEAGGLEYDTVKTATERTREILESIDKQVANQLNRQKLVEIQASLDTSGLDKMGADHPIYREYRSLDLTHHSMLHDGGLTMKLGDTKRVKALHVLLLEDCLMLLQKQGDKYQLKFHAAGTGTAAGEKAKDDRRLFHSPIIKFSTMLVRPVATDKRAFYLLNTTERGPQIYELLASSGAEREKWIRYITDASTAYKSGQAGMPATSKSVPDDLVRESWSEKAKADTRRIASFRDKTSSPRLERADRQNSSPPEGLNIPRREGEEGEAGREEAQAVPKKRLQRVEILKIVDSTPMIEPSQVHVNQATVLLADPVVTPFEKLRQKDEEVSRILEEKQRIIAEILHIPDDNFEVIADMAASTQEPNKEAKEILLAALTQAKSLTQFVNSSLRVGEEDLVARGSPARELPGARSALGPPGDQLVSITTSMNQHLTDLLAVLQERDEERDVLRRQLAKSQDQIRGFYRSDSARSFPSQMSGSRPDSFISLESEGEEGASCHRPLSFLSLTESDCTAEEESREDRVGREDREDREDRGDRQDREDREELPPPSTDTDLTPTGGALPPLPSPSLPSSPTLLASSSPLQHSQEGLEESSEEGGGQAGGVRDSVGKEWTPENEDGISCQ